MITLMDLIEFNIKIMQKIKNTGKNTTKKKKIHLTAKTKIACD